MFGCEYSKFGSDASQSKWKTTTMANTSSRATRSKKKGQEKTSSSTPTEPRKRKAAPEKAAGVGGGAAKKGLTKAKETCKGEATVKKVVSTISEERVKEGGSKKPSPKRGAIVNPPKKTGALGFPAAEKTCKKCDSKDNCDDDLYSLLPRTAVVLDFDSESEFSDHVRGL